MTTRFVLREADTESDLDAVVALMTEYLTWGRERLLKEYGIEDPPGDPALIRQGLGQYRSPDGLLVLAEMDDGPVGVGALRQLSQDVAEVKRMYVTPRARGSHIGSAILDRLLHEADARKVPILRLDTVRFLDRAQELYRSRGFIERDPYPGTEIPPDLQMHWRFFERVTTRPE
jgi:N-acetylglutamate synthase-like GNAT family acetyltransferase